MTSVDGHDVVSAGADEHQGISSGLSQATPDRSLRSVSSNDSDVTLTVGDGPFDFEKILRHVIKKREETDIKARSLGVVFKDLKVQGLGASVSYQPTLGSVINPLNFLDTLQKLRHPPVREIIDGFEGVVKPGEMLLVLGRPGSGCSTFLKTLANQRDEYYAVEGEVHYDSLSPDDIKQFYRGDVQYCPEDDIHFPTLTVEETLIFASQTRTPRSRVGGMSRKEYTKAYVDVLLTVFGLRHARKTLVGDASIRGVSGGEKKRVSIAEALATRSLLCAWDNSTRGLDSSTALEFGRALRIATDIAHLTTIVSIYQAGESLYQLFDKVCVIYGGKMAYFGPANQARQYFIDMGYKSPNRQTTADFLVAVTDPKGRTLRSDNVLPVPHTSAEFAAYFKASSFGQENASNVAQYRSQFVESPERAEAYRSSARAERAQHMPKTSPYTISLPMQTRAVMLRRVEILKGNMGAQIIQIASFTIKAIIIGTVFLKVPDSTSGYFSRGGVLFFALLFAAINSLSEIPALFTQHPIVLRHYKAAMYHPYIEALALTLVDIPITFFTLLLFSMILYLLVGLQKSAGQFFTFFIFVFVLTVTLKSFFRMLAAGFKDPAPAQALAGLFLMGSALYTGYTIPKRDMIGALRWITYIDPLRFGYEGILTNEFHTVNGICATLVPQGPGYEGVSLANQVCTTVGSLPGQVVVDGARYVALSYGYYYHNTWRNFGIVCVFVVGFIAIYLFLTEIKTSSAAVTAVTLFKRGSRTVLDDKRDVSDEEKVAQSAVGDSEKRVQDDEEQVPAHPDFSMTDVFSWLGLQYTVPVSGGHRKLLNDVSGYVAPGRLTALMGESGAGKTTLLNVLAQRTTVGVVQGDLFVSGHRLPPDFQAQTGYCQQMDTHLETSTIREALLFSANLRQPQRIPQHEKEAWVEECLNMCGLRDHADAVVGTLSVEHRKRTTIAVELAAKPKLLLFLDEPTSGLDSQSAWAIVKFLRKLADNGQAILCTIHQPSAELFQVFDRLLLLRKGGQTVYFGDLGKNSSTLIRYFHDHGARSCAPDENPAEYMLDVIGAGATATSQLDWHDVWKKSKEAEDLTKELDAIHDEGRKRPPVETELHTEFSTSWMHQVAQLTKRDVQSHWRSPTYLLAKILLNIVGGLFIGFTFFKSKNTLQGTQDKLFAVYMSLVMPVALSQQLQVPFIHMRNIYEVRERPSRMYSWTALLTSQILAEIPWNIIGSTLFFLCWYWTVGFPDDRAGYTYLMLGIAFPLYYTTIGQAVAAMSASAQIASLIFGFLFSFVLIFNGVLQPYAQLGWWQWMYRLSPFTYLIEGLLGQSVGKTLISCSDVEYVTLTPPSGLTCGDYMQAFISYAGGYLADPNATSGCQFCSSRTTDQLLATYFNIEYAHRWRNFGLFFVYIAFNTAAIYVFTYVFRIQSGNPLGALRRRISRR
ncbi:hypothetical protein NEOLEDRAFT_1063724 [Neolentinus lepideus HHB14362 ss-1]|uniref:ABC transporter domain-containing protein n=1 Tax=Neolentinus lepideus HHB14362 ss-1 TaxID=1314782 RepID=A0A165T313_9AGAM|nr:hypothetical protein NEOLEDRAFT_1063724 [Neolentinus lepideus HHB14362 ss-1]